MIGYGWRPAVQPGKRQDVTAFNRKLQGSRISLTNRAQRIFRIHTAWRSADNLWLGGRALFRDRLKRSSRRRPAGQPLEGAPHLCKAWPPTAAVRTTRALGSAPVMCVRGVRMPAYAETGGPIVRKHSLRMLPDRSGREAGEQLEAGIRSTEDGPVVGRCYWGRSRWHSTPPTGGFHSACGPPGPLMRSPICAPRP